MGKTLKKMLKKLVVKDVQETLAVADAKLGNCIKVLTTDLAHKFNSVTLMPCKTACDDTIVTETCVETSLVSSLPLRQSFHLMPEIFGIFKSYKRQGLFYLHDILQRLWNLTGTN